MNYTKQERKDFYLDFFSTGLWLKYKVWGALISTYNDIIDSVSNLEHFDFSNFIKNSVQEGNLFPLISNLFKFQYNKNNLNKQQSNLPAEEQIQLARQTGVIFQVCIIQDKTEPLTRNVWAISIPNTRIMCKQNKTFF